MTIETMSAAEIAMKFLPVLTALGVVSFVFLSSLGVIWCLKKIGGRLSAEVKGNIERCGGSLIVTGTGLMGCYLALVTAELVGLYAVWHMIR